MNNVKLFVFLITFILSPMFDVSYRQAYSQNSLEKLDRDLSDDNIETINKCIEQPNYIFCEKNNLFVDYLNIVNQFDIIYSEVLSYFDPDKKYTYEKTLSKIESLNKLQNLYYLKYYRADQLLILTAIKNDIYLENENYESVLSSLKEIQYLLRNNYVQENILEIDIEQVEYEIKQMEEIISAKRQEELWNKASKIYDQGVNAIYADRYKTAMNYFQQAYNLFSQLGDYENAQIVQNQMERLQKVCGYYGQAIYNETLDYLNQGTRAIQSGSQSPVEALFNTLGNIFNSSTRASNPCDD